MLHSTSSLKSRALSRSGWRDVGPLRSRPKTNKPSFGFTGPEIFPIDNQIALLHAADLDGDGLTDLIVVNNSRSKINILYNQTGKTNAARRSPA